MNECYGCGFWDSEREGCSCASYEKWYACPIESKKPENQQALQEYAEWLQQFEGKFVLLQKGMKKMTKKEALKKWVLPALQRTWNEKKVEEILKALLQEPCCDAVSKDAVDTLVDELATAISDERCCISRGRSTATIMQDILDLPPVTSKQKMGYWITKIKSDLMGDMWSTNPKCSVCGGEPYYSNTIYNYKFCPYCGAKMVDPQESEKQI